MEVHHLKFLANFPYQLWAEVVYIHFSFDDDMNKLMRLFSLPREKAIGEIKRYLIKKFPDQPEWVLHMVAKENMKELVKVFHKYEFQTVN